MASLATLRHVVRFLNTLDGRDQSAKLMQYGSRAAMHFIRLQDADSLLALRLERTYKGASTGRKLFRLLKWLKEYQAALDSLQTAGADAVYLMADNAVWFGKNKVFDMDTKSIGKRAATFWTLGLSCTLAADLMQIQEHRAKREVARRFLRSELKKDGEEEMKKDEAEKIVAAAPAKLLKLYLSVLKVVPSVLVAANAAQWIQSITGSKLSDGVVGLCGVVAASTNVYKTWKATA